MSRSTKKSPVWTEQSKRCTRWVKRQAGKAVRRYKSDIANGKSYRKLFCSWNICDYRSRKTRMQAIRDWETNYGQAATRQERRKITQDWARTYFKR